MFRGVLLQRGTKFRIRTHTKTPKSKNPDLRKKHLNNSIQRTREHGDYVYGDYVYGDYVYGDYVYGDYVYGDYVYGDM